MLLQIARRHRSSHGNNQRLLGDLWCNLLQHFRDDLWLHAQQYNVRTLDSLAILVANRDSEFLCKCGGLVAVLHGSRNIFRAKQSLLQVSAQQNSAQFARTKNGEFLIREFRRHSRCVWPSSRFPCGREVANCIRGRKTANCICGRKKGQLIVPDAERGVNNGKDHCRASSLPCKTYHCVRAPLNVLFRGGPRRHADTHCRLALPHGATAPARAIFLNTANDLERFLRRSEGCQNLVDYHIVQNFESRVLQPGGKSASHSARTLNQITQPASPQALQRSP